MDTPKADKENGLRKMIRQGRQLFRIPENMDHYSAEHFKDAEKIFIKRCVIEGQCGLMQPF
jgi:hypothetical protein